MNTRKLACTALCMIAGALICSATPALAETDNAYRSQFSGSETAASFIYPSALAFDSSGDVFVSDGEHNTVDEFSASGGALLKEIPLVNEGGEPFGAFAMVVNASGDLFVTDSFGGVVVEFNPAGKLVAQISGAETAAKSFEPWGLALNSSGDLYVSDFAHGVVDEFGPSGTGHPIAELTGVETNAKSFGPSGLALDTSDNLYVIDRERAHVVELNSSGKLVRELTGSNTPQGSFGGYVPSLVTTPSGELYVANTEAGVVDRFSAAGAYLSQVDGGATPQGSFEPPALALNASEELYVGDGAREQPSEVLHGVVDIYSKPVPIPVVTTGAASEVESDRATLSGNIEPTTGLDATCEFRYGTEAAYLDKEPYAFTAPCVPAGPFSSLTAVSADIEGLQPETTYHYRLEGTTSNGTSDGEDATFATPTKVVLPPTVAIKPVTALTRHSATFEGEVNPNGAETTYHFEYTADGEHWIALAEASAGEGTSEVAVTQTASGLTGHTTYHVRLVAENICTAGSSGCAASTSSEAAFSTQSGPPEVVATAATDVTASEATLHATINPENQPATTYRFEYGPTAAYGTTLPAREGHLGSTPTPVAQSIAGLASGATYHFRVVASNGVGAPTVTADEVFRTFPTTAGTAVCPNEQLRGESAVNPETGVPFSLALPECRAYEMVSPVLKNGAPVSSAPATGLSSASSVARVGVEGSTVLLRSTGSWPGPEQPANNDLLENTAEGMQYKITRGESGWGFRPEEPPGLRAFRGGLLPSSGDMSTGDVWIGAGTAPGELHLETDSNPNFYLLAANGSLPEVGPSVPLSDRGVTEGRPRGTVSPVGASRDRSHLFFDVQDFRWPFDQTRTPPAGEIPSLYEYVGGGHSGEGADVPSLVGVDNTGALISECGTEAGGLEAHFGTARRLAGSVEPEARSVSAGGSSVFFTASASGSECSAGTGGGPLVDQVFARVGEPGPGTAVGSAVTVNVAGRAGCATSDSCDVSKAISFQGASADGSSVFFSSEQPLVASDSDGSENLYECLLPGDSGASLSRVSLVNPCPELVRVSVPLSGGAEVQSVAAVSGDGSHVYFLAKGVLSGENAEHSSPTAGASNLYVWEAPGAGRPQGRTAFIATLSGALGFDEAQTTPDGRSLVFSSADDLTPDDTSTVSQVFLYEADNEALIRVSKGQDGFNDDGNPTTDPASITARPAGLLESQTLEGRRVISDDGSTIVFQSSAALTAGVHGGTQNVYLWRAGNVYLISDGTSVGDKHAGPEPYGKAGLVGIDASGQNVFFTTEAPLVGQDSDDLSDLYDARVDGGFPAPRVNGCSGEACQGALAAPLAPVSLGSLAPTGGGNLAPQKKTKAKALTRAQKLAEALKACGKEKARKRREQCAAQARKRFGAKSKAKAKGGAKLKAKHKTGKSSARRGK